MNRWQASAKGTGTAIYLPEIRIFPMNLQGRSAITVVFINYCKTMS